MSSLGSRAALCPQLVLVLLCVLNWFSCCLCRSVSSIGSRAACAALCPRLHEVLFWCAQVDPLLEALAGLQQLQQQTLVPTEEHPTLLSPTIQMQANAPEEGSLSAAETKVRLLAPYIFVVGTQKLLHCARSHSRSHTIIVAVLVAEGVVHTQLLTTALLTNCTDRLHTTHYSLAPTHSLTTHSH